MITKRIKMLFSAFAISIPILTISIPASATLVYSNDFDGPVYVLGGVSASGLPGGFLGTVTGGPYSGSNGKSWSDRYFGSDGSTTLTLDNLSSHSTVGIDMMLGFLNSWDSRDGVTWASPDNLDVYIDGSLTLSMTTNNGSGSIVDFAGGTQVVNDGQIDGMGYYSDDLVDMATAPLQNIAHTASTLTLTIQASGSGWQRLDDEGWGIDALSVTMDGTGTGVPEPATLALLALGLAGIGFSRRKAT